METREVAGFYLITHAFKMNLHFGITRMSRNFSLETGTISETQRLLNTEHFDKPNNNTTI